MYYIEHIAGQPFVTIYGRPVQTCARCGALLFKEGLRYRQPWPVGEKVYEKGYQPAGVSWLTSRPTVGVTLNACR